jgi:hypothetical protein
MRSAVERGQRGLNVVQNRLITISVSLQVTVQDPSPMSRFVFFLSLLFRSFQTVVLLSFELLLNALKGDLQPIWAVV